MAHSIDETCIKCGACAATCPCSAITEGEMTYEINPSICMDCAKCVEVCPVGAIHPVE